MKTVRLVKLPKCYFCGKDARFDGATKRGPWAYMCQRCMKTNGTGFGTKLITKEIEMTIQGAKEHYEFCKAQE